MRLQCGHVGLFWAKNIITSRVSVGRSPSVSVKIHAMIPGRWRGSRVGTGLWSREGLLARVPVGWTQRRLA